MHTNPETLALLALGEHAGTSQDRHHVSSCAECSAEVSGLAHLADLGRGSRDDDPLLRPDPQVWERIQAELGFIAVAPLVGDDLGDAGDQASPRVNGTGTAGANVVNLADRSPRAVEPEGPGGVEVGSGARPRASRGSRLLSLAVASALALIAGLGIGVGWNRWFADKDQVVATAELAPGGPQWTGASGQAELQVDDQGHRWLVVTAVSTPRPVTHERQLWVISDIDPGQMKNLGPLYNTGQRFRVDGIDLKRFPLVDISDEPDANPAHSGNTILRGPLNL